MQARPHRIEFLRGLVCTVLAVGGIYLLPGSFTPEHAGVAVDAAYECESGKAVLSPWPSPAPLTGTRIDDRRVRIRGQGSFCFGLHFGLAKTPHFLSMRFGPEQVGGAVSVAVATADGWIEQDPVAIPPSGGRATPATVIALPRMKSHLGYLQVSVERVKKVADASLVIEEVSLLEGRYDQERLLTLRGEDWSTAGSASVALSWLTLLGIVVLCVPRPTTSRWWVPAFAFALALAASALGIRQRYAGPDGYDFRVTAANVNLQNGNLSEGLVDGARILERRSYAFEKIGTIDPDYGLVPAYRMPGFAIFVSLAGTLFRVSPTDAVGLAEATAWLQVLFFVVSLVALAAVLPLVMPIPVAAILTAALCWFPQNFGQTQGDSIVLYCTFLIAATLCLYLRWGNQRTPTSGYDVAVHAAFGLSLLVRSDVLIGWSAVSLFLYRHSWRRLAMPVLFVVTITGSFGLYKVAHGGRFVPTTSNVGHVAFVGLWQVPEHRFAWEPSDASYDAWIKAHGYRYASASANTFAIREVARFWLTFPGYTISTSWHKLDGYLRGPSPGGALSPSFALDSMWVVDPGMPTTALVRWPLVLALWLSLAAGHQVSRTLALGWPLFFNLPVFCLLQSGGDRFVTSVTCAIALAGVPLILDRAFYQALRAQARRTVPVAIVLVVLWVAGPTIDLWMRQSPTFRYSTPFLSPANSTLNVLR